MYRTLILITCLTCSACAYKQGQAKVSYGTPEPIQLVQTPKDKSRWYVVLKTEDLGERVFFLDTGYGNTTCDDDFVAELGLETHGKSVIYGESGKTKATKAIIPPFTLGGHRVEKVVCTVRDLNTTSSIRDPQTFAVAGVLGMDALRPFRTLFQPHKKQIQLLNPEDQPDLIDGFKLRREYRFGLRATIQVQINDRKRWLIIDTGASITLANGRTLDLAPEYQLSSGTVSGSGNGRKPKSLSRYRVQELGIAGLPRGEGILYDRRRGPFFLGLLGLNVLRHYEHLYDWKAGRALFVPVEPVKLPIHKPSLQSE